MLKLVASVVAEGIIIMKHCWNDPDEGKQKKWEKSLFKWHFVTTHSTLAGLESKLRFEIIKSSSECSTSKKEGINYNKLIAKKY